MTTAKRAYINKTYNQYVDDECLEYRSVPMAVVNTMLKVKHPVSSFTGVKRVFNNIPARPKNLNTLATTIARMNGMDYSKVGAIAMKIGDEERTAVTQFVKGNKDPFEEIVGFTPQTYVAEQPTQSTTGIRLEGSGEKTSPQLKTLSRTREVELLLGDESLTYNTPPLNLRSTFTRARFVPVNQMNFIDEETGMREVLKMKKITRDPSLGTPNLTIVEREAQKRVNKIMGDETFVNLPKSESDISRYLGVESKSEIRHSNRDSVFGKHFVIQ